MILPIIFEPDPILRQQSQPVKKVTKRIKTLMDNMLETMYEADGVGLAAPQVGINERMIVIDVGKGPILLINPEITVKTGQERDVEGCLSIPGKNAYITRASKVEVVGIDPKGKKVQIKAEGLLARAFQHEIDHLDGILFIDYVSKEGSELEN